jgi:hypothetical protein
MYLDTHGHSHQSHRSHRWWQPLSVTTICAPTGEREHGREGYFPKSDRVVSTLSSKHCRLHRVACAWSASRSALSCTGHAGVLCLHGCRLDAVARLRR